MLAAVAEAVPPETTRELGPPRYRPDPNLLIWSPHRLLMRPASAGRVVGGSPEPESEVRQRYSPKHTWSPPWLSPEGSPTEDQRTPTARHSPRKLELEQQSTPVSSPRGGARRSLEP